MKRIISTLPEHLIGVLGLITSTKKEETNMRVVKTVDENGRIITSIEGTPKFPVSNVRFVCANSPTSRATGLCASDLKQIFWGKCSLVIEQDNQSVLRWDNEMTAEDIAVIIAARHAAFCSLLESYIEQHTDLFEIVQKATFLKIKEKEGLLYYKTADGSMVKIQ